MRSAPRSSRPGRGHSRCVRRAGRSDFDNLFAPRPGVRVWDLEDAGSLLLERDHGEYIVDIALSPDGRVLAVTGAKAAVLCDLAEDSTQFIGDNTLFATLSPDGLHGATYSIRDDVRVWRLNGTQKEDWEVPALRGNDGPRRRSGEEVKRIDFSSAGRWLLTTTRETTTEQLFPVKQDTVWVHDVHTGALMGSVIHGAEIVQAITSPDDRLLVTCASDKTLRVWEVGKDEDTPAIDLGQRPVVGIALGLRTSFLAIAQQGPDVRLLTFGAETETVLHGPGTITAVNVAASGALVTSGSAGAVVWARVKQEGSRPRQASRT